ncbi:CoA transferase [Ruegeria arenilitoris]|nr:CoA transferase [Ruegeria arenilitoris]
MCSRGKSALELDLKSANCLPKALDLAARSDVVLKTFALR